MVKYTGESRKTDRSSGQFGKAQTSAFWTKLASPHFLTSAIAALLAYQGFATGWFVSSVLMTELTDDPILIAMVHAAVHIPLLVVTLPAGELSSRFDRRILLLVAHTLTALLLMLYAMIASQLGLSPALLIIMLFSLGLTAAFAMSLWQIAGPDLVDQTAVAAATTAISGSFNLARMIGPLIGAASLQGLGITPTLLVSGGFVVLGIGLLLAVRWPLRPDPTSLGVRAEATGKPLAYSLSGSLNRRALQILLISVCGSAVWALLPTLVQGRFPDDVAASLGLLTSSLGAGALVGAFAAKAAHSRLALSSVLKLSAVMMFLLMAGIAWPLPLWLSCLLAVGMGTSWFLNGTTLNISVRIEAPARLRGHMVARFLMTFYFGMAIGSILWGALASHLGAAPTLFVAAVGVFVSSVLERGSIPHRA